MMSTKSVVLRPVDDGPLIVLAPDGSTLVSDEAGELQRCKNLRDALERCGWVYVNTVVRH
jgi:hypothetical protein